MSRKLIFIEKHTHKRMQRAPHLNDMKCVNHNALIKINIKYLLVVKGPSWGNRSPRVQLESTELTDNSGLII